MSIINEIVRAAFLFLFSSLAAAAGKGVLIKKGLVSGHLDSLHSDQADPVAESLRFIFRKPGISSVIVGTINPRHLEHNANCVAAILSS